MQQSYRVISPWYYRYHSRRLLVEHNRDYFRLFREKHYEKERHLQQSRSSDSRNNAWNCQFRIMGGCNNLVPIY